MKTYKNIEDLYDQLLKSKLAKLLETLDNKIQFTEDHKSINIYNPNTGNELEIDKLILESDKFWRHELSSFTLYIFAELKHLLAKKDKYYYSKPTLYFDRDIKSFDELFDLNFSLFVEYQVISTDKIDLQSLYLES
jgi:hypothetical protein